MDVKSELRAFQQHGTLVEFPEIGGIPAPRGSTASGGHRIFVSEYGKGPPLVFLHGFPTSSFDFVRLIPILAPHRRLIFFDFLGFGFSDKPRPHRYSLFEQAEITELLVQKLGLTTSGSGPEAIELVAHDMGTSVAALLLQRARLKVKKLVLLNGSLLLEHYRPLLSQRLLLSPFWGPILSALRILRRPIFARQFRRLFPKPVPDDEIDAFWSQIKYRDGVRIYHLLIHYLRERAQHEKEWLDALATYPVPILLLWGQLDPVSRPRIAEAIVEEVTRRRAQPDLRYVPLPELGHYPQWEDPETIGRQILTFLEDPAT